MHSVFKSIKKSCYRLQARAIATFVLFLQGLRPMTLVGNIGEGTHVKNVTRLADAAITTRYLLVKQGTDASHIAVSGAADVPYGVCTDEPAAAEDLTNVNLLGATSETQRMVASGAILANAFVYADASGKVSAEPTIAGTYYRVGRALIAAAADGDVIEVETCFPQAVLVLATLGNVNGVVAALAIGGTYSQAEVTALRNAVETLGDDVRAIAGALTTAKSVIVL